MIFLTILIDGNALYAGDEVFVRHLVKDPKISTDCVAVPEIKAQARHIAVNEEGRVYLVHTEGMTPVDCVLRTSSSDHSDDFIYYNYGQCEYPRFFLMLQRLPAALKFDFEEFISEYKLFARYQDIWYRVTGASRLGDIWLQPNFDLGNGYEKRVLVKDIQEWRREPPNTTGVCCEFDPNLIP